MNERLGAGDEMNLCAKRGARVSGFLKRGRMTSMQRRRAERFACRLPALIQSNAGERPLPAAVFNLSAHGLGLDVQNERLMSGQELEVRILSSGNQVRFRGIVRWAQAGGAAKRQLGLELATLPEQSFDALVERERAAHARSRQPLIPPREPAE
jgi:hypothetical protein